MKLQKPKRLVWLLATVSIVALLVGITLSILYIAASGDFGDILSHQFLVPFFTIAYAIIGALVASRQSKNAIGWIFLAVALLSSLNALSTGYGLYGPTLWGVASFPGYEWAHWLGAWVWIPGSFAPIIFVFLLFPDGHLLSLRWRLVAWPAVLGLSMAVIGAAFHPGPVESWGLMDPNPYGIAALSVPLELTLNIGAVLLMVGLIGSIISLIVRFRRSRGIERTQMKWLVYAAGLMLFGYILGGVLWALWPNSHWVTDLSIILTELAILGVAVAASIAILRYRLYDIDVIINRTLVYGALTAGVVSVYVLVVGGFGVLLQSSGNLLAALLATGLVALLFQPLRERLQRAVNRLMYGERDNPVVVLTRLGQRLETTIAPEAVIPTLVETVAQALKLPYTAVELRSGDGNVVAAYGLLPVDEPLRLPLVYQTEIIGYLLVAPRSPGESFTPADMKLLETIAYQAGTAVHAVQLTADLQRSRQQLVTAREEERRRLRRDLHDGLGPHLASQMLTIDAIGKLLKQDPAQAESLLQDLKHQSQSAITDIRRLVYDLRPPALDDLGLVAALREVARHYQQSGLRIDIDAPERLPPLPAAVEVAAYLIAQEALTNVVRHAQADTCHIQLSFNDCGHGQGLLLQIQDDGRGLPPDHRAGVGCQAMRERATELGGYSVIESQKSGGTQVSAWLPLIEEDA